MQASQETSFSTILGALEKHVLSDTEHWGMDNIFTASPSWQALQSSHQLLPEGAYITRCKLRSQRVPVKGKRIYGNAAWVDATWPEDGLESKRMPTLCFVLRGAVAMQLGNYIFHCTPRQGVLIPAGVPHSDGSHTYLDNSRPNAGICDLLMMRPLHKGVECWLSHTRNDHHWSHVAGDVCHVFHQQAKLYLENLEHEAVARQLRHAEICDALLTSLTSLIFREIKESRAYQFSATQKRSTSSYVPYDGEDPIARIVEYLHGHLNEHLSIDQMARYAGVSRSSLTRQFRATTGKSFVAYLSDCRLNEAQILLRDSDWAISRICHDVGIKPAYIRKLFVAHFGVSPSDYRRKSRKKSKDKAKKHPSS